MKKETLAERLNQAMDLSGMSQGALAKASGVAQPTIWRLTSGNAGAQLKLLRSPMRLAFELSGFQPELGRCVQMVKFLKFRSQKQSLHLLTLFELKR